LPAEIPEFAPYDVAGVNISSSEVGGDYYDFIPITATDLGIAIADVTGHGAGAALMMATYRACLRIESRNNFAIRAILSKVNDFIYETNPADAFVTAVYGVLDRQNHVFSYSNAGHNWPLLLRRSGAVEQLDTGGLLMGAFPRVKYEEARVKLHPGDTLLLFTDGATEATRTDGEQFGDARLLASLKAHRAKSALELVRAIRADVIEFRSEDEFQDDLTLSVIKYV
jgi:sigma-B regulation protein RsbU (phosphoserine phosphatase)